MDSSVRDVDRPPSTESTNVFRQLDVSERLFIWGFRAMAQHHKLGWPSNAELRQVFDKFRVGDGVFQLDALVEAFARTALAPIEIHCANCPCVSTDELFLLRAVAATQYGALETARREFERWLPGPAADWVLTPMRGLGRLFRTAGLTLPLRAGEPEAMHDIVDTRTWPVGSLALH